MLVNKIIKVVLLILAVIYILLIGLTLEEEGAALSSIILILLTLLYHGWTKHKSKLFLSFLILFTVANSVGYLTWISPEIKEGETDYLYYLSNSLYILAYSLLIVKMIKQLNLKAVFSVLIIPIIVLIVLDIFCVTLISGTTKSIMDYSQYILEYTYNAVVMILLSFALINYMYRNNNKSMLFLIGCIFMVFSEIIQLAYYYILSDDTLGFVYSFFSVIAFMFFYMQSQHKVTEPVAAYVDEPIEV